MIEEAIISIASFTIGAFMVFTALYIQARAHDKLVEALLTQIRYLQRMNVAKDLSVFGGMTEIEERNVESKPPERLVREAAQNGGIPEMTADGFFPGSGTEHMGG